MYIQIHQEISLILALPVNEVQDFRLRVVNLLGEEIIKEDMQQFVGEYVKTINLNQYKKGVYLLEIQTQDGKINNKLILQ